MVTAVSIGSILVLINELFEGGLIAMAVELLGGLHGTDKVGLKLWLQKLKGIQLLGVC